MRQTFSAHWSPRVFEKALDRVTGQMNASLHARARRRLPHLVHDVMSEAINRWASNNWDRFDQREVNCTIQLYRWLKAAQRADKRFNVLEIGIENVIPTPAMIEGTESVTTAARSDLRIGVQGGEMTVEAKRLASTGAWCRDYVNEGMARFVEATYAAAEDLGMMVGYIQQPNVDGVRERVNSYVLAHASMGVGHEVADRTARGHCIWLGSAHKRPSGGPIDLRHLWVVIPATP